MKSTLSQLWIAVLFIASLLFISNVTTFADSHGPNTDLGPEEVVREQLNALRNNGPENEGIERTFRFASPENRESTGPLERFAALFETRAYQPMLNHVSSELLEPVIDGNVALVPVILSRSDGSTFNYVFALSKQTDAPYEDMWMTDAVRFQGSGTQPEFDPESTI